LRRKTSGAAGYGLSTAIKYLRSAVGIGLGTTIKHLRGAAGIGLGTTIKYLRRSTSGAASNGLGTTIKYLRGAARIGLGTTAKYLQRTTNGAAGNGLSTAKKKNTARCGGGLHSCLRNCFLREPRCAKTHLEKLEFGLGPNLTIIGNFNLRTESHTVLV
jgi:hypothetical protein